MKVTPLTIQLKAKRTASYELKQEYQFNIREHVKIWHLFLRRLIDFW